MLVRLVSWQREERYEDGQLIRCEYFLKFRPIEERGDEKIVRGRLLRIVLPPEGIPDNLEPGALYELHKEFYMKRECRFIGISPVGPVS